MTPMRQCSRTQHGGSNKQELGPTTFSTTSLAIKNNSDDIVINKGDTLNIIQELQNQKTNADDAIKAIETGHLVDAKTLVEQMEYDLSLVKLHLDATIHLAH
jgi:hypothetical protein